MGQTNIKEALLTRENMYKLIWTLFGFTLFPCIIYAANVVFSPSASTLTGYYSNLYGSLLDLGKDGMYAWCIVCAPYMAYEVYLLAKYFLVSKKNDS